MNANALLYDRYSLNFINKQFKIVPQYIVYALKYMRTVFQSLISFDRERFEGHMNDLYGRYDDERKTYSDFLPEVINQEETTSNLLQMFETTSFVRDKSG